MTSYPTMSKIKKSSYGGYVGTVTISRGRKRLISGATMEACQAEGAALIAQLTAPVSAEEAKRSEDARVAEMLRVDARRRELATPEGQAAWAQSVAGAKHAGCTDEEERRDYEGGQF